MFWSVVLVFCSSDPWFRGFGGKEVIVDHGKSCTVCLFEDSGPVKRFAMVGEQAAPNVVYNAWQKHTHWQNWMP